MENKTHWKKLTNTNYLGSWDIPDNENILATIKNVEQSEIFNQQKQAKELCTTLKFVEKNILDMVCNKTNLKTLELIFKSPFVEDWQNKKINIGKEKIRAFGKLEEALRIKKELPNKKLIISENNIFNSLKCEECVNQILTIGSFSAKYIADTNKEKYGKKICGECSKKRSVNNEIK